MDASKKQVTVEMMILTSVFDPTDLGSMCELMDKYGESETMFMGVNTEGEDTTISVATENIVYVTYQHNGRVRKNIYWRDGTQEETFDDRWKSVSDHA